MREVTSTEVRDDLGGVAGTQGVTLGARRRLGRAKPADDVALDDCRREADGVFEVGRPHARRPAPSPARRIGARVRRTR